MVFAGRYQEIVRQLKLELKEYENLRELKEKINRLQVLS